MKPLKNNDNKFSVKYDLDFKNLHLEQWKVDIIFPLIWCLAILTINRFFRAAGILSVASVLLGYVVLWVYRIKTLAETVFDVVLQMLERGTNKND